MKCKNMSLLVLAAVLLFACSNKEAAPDAGVITLENSEDVLFPETGGTSYVSFSATGAWTVRESADWLAVDPTSGQAGESLRVTLAASANSAGPKQTATLTFTCGKDVKTLNVILAECIEVPEKPVDEPVTWPTSADAFDYGLAAGETRKASIAADLMAAKGVSSTARAIGTAMEVDGVTYGGPGLAYYGNRISVEKFSNSFSETFPETVPASRYMSFKINRPGTLRFYPAVASKDGNALRIPTYYLVLVTKIKGVTSARIIQEVTPKDNADGTLSENRADNNIYLKEDWAKYWVSMSVSREDLKGIEEAATVYLYHQNPSVNSLSVYYWPLEWTVSEEEDTPAAGHKPKVLLAGDSTCAKSSEATRPKTGWGECMEAALGEGARVQNFAVGGESSKSFIDEGRWQNLCNAIVKDDIVLIQFGHNDQKVDDAHATDPYTTYSDNLKKMVADVREKGGVPVLLTSICRRYFNSDGTPRRSMGEYPAAMRAVAKSTDTPLIDMENKTYDWLKETGVEGSKQYYMLDRLNPGGTVDNTHLTKDGAEAVAGMIAKDLKDLGIWK